MNYKKKHPSKRTKACDITNKVKIKVWERDEYRCIFCGSSQAMPNVHYIPRAKGGLGIEQNVVTACIECHMLLDQSVLRKEMLEKAKRHLQKHYEDWNEESLVYKK